MNNEQMNNSLLDTMKSPYLEGITIDLGEIILDQLTGADGAIKDIPIIGSFVKTIKLGLTVKDVIFIKKLGEFLWNLKDIPTEKRIELIRMLEKDSKNKNNAGEKILLLLERADDFEKPKFMANAFKAYLNLKISYSQLQKINFALDHLYIGDIKDFELFWQNPKHHMDESTHHNLALCGLVYSSQVLSGGTRVKINEFGELFAKNVLECR